MNTHSLRRAALSIALATAGAGAVAQTVPQTPPNEQVVVPEVDRRDVKPPKFPSNDFAGQHVVADREVVVGQLLGLVRDDAAGEDLAEQLVADLGAGYHLTEDFFFEGVYARTKISDELFRQIFPGSIIPNQAEKLTYYNLSVGYNVLPGEVFFGGKYAKPAALYLIAGVGSTKVGEQRRPTYNLGVGYRVFLADWVALQVDMRDHIFSLDLLGLRTSTQNLELTAGLTVFF